MDKETAISALSNEIAALQRKRELYDSIPENYYEPGLMENLDRYFGYYDSKSGKITIRTEVKGLRYEGRTERLDTLDVGDDVRIIRDSENSYNSNNFAVRDSAGASLGNLPATLCNVMAPLYDDCALTIVSSTVSYLEKIGERSRYADRGVLFVDIKMMLEV